MSCVPFSIRIYLDRVNLDSNPLIVKMIPKGGRRFMSHWYYRSDQFIASRFGPEGTDFVGEISQMPLELLSFYGQFEIASKPLGWAKSAIELGLSYEDYLAYLKMKRNQMEL